MDDAAVEHWIDAIGLPALEQVRDRQPESLTADVRRQAARDVILTVRETRGPANPDGTRPTVFNLRLVASIVLAEVQVWLAYGPPLVGGELPGSHQERIPVAGATIDALASNLATKWLAPVGNTDDRPMKRCRRVLTESTNVRGLHAHDRPYKAMPHASSASSHRPRMLPTGGNQLLTRCAGLADPARPAGGAPGRGGTAPAPGPGGDRVNSRRRRLRPKAAEWADGKFGMLAPRNVSTPLRRSRVRSLRPCSRTALER
jgi:hypothetical protein